MQVESIEPSARKGKRLPDEEAATDTGKPKKRPKRAKVGISAPAFEDSTFEDFFKHPEALQEQDRLRGLAQDLANGKISLEDLRSAIKKAVADRQVVDFDENSFDEHVEWPEDFFGALEGLEYSAQAKIAHREHLDKIAEGKTASSVKNHNIGTFNRMGAGSNPSSPITEASILGPSPFRSAVAPDHSSAWSTSVLSTVGVRSALPPNADATSVAPSTHGQLEAAHDAVTLPSRAAQAPGHSPAGWPASVSTTAGALMALQPIAVVPAVPEPACGRLEIAHLASVDREFLQQLQVTAVALAGRKSVGERC